MLGEEVFTEFWQKMLIVKLSHNIPDGSDGLLTMIEIFRETITFYARSADEIKKLAPQIEFTASEVTGVTDKTIETTISNAPSLIGPFISGVKVDDHSTEEFPYIKVDFQCENHVVKLISNDVITPDLRARHNFWHIKSNMNASHSHFSKANFQNLTQADIECIFEKFQAFEAEQKIKLIDKKDIIKITRELKRQKEKGNKFAADLTTNFFIIAASSFVLELVGKYLMPLVFDNTNHKFFNKHRDKILLMTKLIQSFVSLFILLSNLPVAVTGSLKNLATLSLRICNNVSGMISQYLNINWLPQQLFYFFDICLLFYSKGLTEETAKKIGFDAAVIFGATSGAALGKVVAFSLIHALPKLKVEESANFEDEATVVNSHKENSMLRQRK